MAVITEHRSFSASLRAEGQGDELSLAGYAALFNVQSKDLGGFREVIAPGAFTRTLKEGGDVKALVNHDPNQLLGRTKNGTLKLEQDDRGLKFRVKLNPKSQAHRDLHAAIKRGDMDECSFALTVPDSGDQWDTATDENGVNYARRTLKDVNLLDVSTVTYPAYDHTSVAARAMSTPDYQTRKQGDTYTRARQTLEQLQRENWAEDLRIKITPASSQATEMTEADRDLQRRMASASGRTVR